MANPDLTPTQRTELEQAKKECLEHLLEIECKLSPENLTCDGELSRSEINRRYRDLDEAKNIEFDNFKMITHMLEGTPREPTFLEIYN